MRSQTERQRCSHLRAYDYDVAVLDWRMPERTGIEVVAEARSRGDRTPILMLTARDTPSDRVAGLNEGADDYLVKPFDFAELVARVQALQRRPPLVVGPVLECGNLRFDPSTREATISGTAVALTAIESALVELLLRRQPKRSDPPEPLRSRCGTTKPMPSGRTPLTSTSAGFARSWAAAVLVSRRCAEPGTGWSRRDGAAQAPPACRSRRWRGHPDRPGVLRRGCRCAQRHRHQPSDQHDRQSPDRSTPRCAPTDVDAVWVDGREMATRILTTRHSSFGRLRPPGRSPP